MALDSVVKNFKVERTIDHGMLEGRGTENPNWIRDEVAEGHRQIKIREIKDSEVRFQEGLIDRENRWGSQRECPSPLPRSIGR